MRVFPSLDFLLFYQKKASSMKQADLRDSGISRFSGTWVKP